MRASSATTWAILPVLSCSTEVVQWFGDSLLRRGRSPISSRVGLDLWRRRKALTTKGTKVHEGNRYGDSASVAVSDAASRALLPEIPTSHSLRSVHELPFSTTCVSEVTDGGLSWCYGFDDFRSRERFARLPPILLALPLQPVRTTPRGFLDSHRKGPRICIRLLGPKASTQQWRRALCGAGMHS